MQKKEEEKENAKWSPRSESCDYERNFEAGVSVSHFHEAGPVRAPWIWFHREVVNMPVFSTSLLFWHAQLRRSSSKVSARGCGQRRSAFTRTQTYASPVSAHNMGGCYCQCPLAGPRIKRHGRSRTWFHENRETAGIRRKTGKMEKTDSVGLMWTGQKKINKCNRSVTGARQRPFKELFIHWVRLCILKVYILFPANMNSYEITTKLQLILTAS